MPAQVITSVENNFTKGLVTEFTGLNFPENAATASDNTEYTIVGDVVRREGIDIEVNGLINAVSTTNQAISTYKWNNVGGDGLTQIVVQQIGGNLYFFKSSSATTTNPLSTQRIASTVALSIFVALNGVFNPTVECQFADGNGYLIVYHPSCDPFFCSYNNGAISAFPIIVKIRDFTGISESPAVNIRPSTLSNEHLYNLTNQGWTQGSPWASVSSSGNTIATGVKTFVGGTGLTVTNGDFVSITNNHPIPYGFNGSHSYVPGGTVLMSGTVTSYVSGTGVFTINVVSANDVLAGNAYGDWFFFPVSTGYINTWLSGIGNYPSNADVWWYFKNSSGVFSPSTTVSNVSLNTGRAPQGHYILPAFAQQRSLNSGIGSLTDVVTSVRPRTGAWFQGRVWYTGVDSSQPATGDAGFYTWTENIYFSKIVQSTDDFGSCYQANDPTSQNLFGLLPTDGGVIQIQGCGSIYKLFPLMNAILVFAANGVWYISGGQSVGFTATDYTVVKLSAVRSISGTSFVDINGLPIFWNEEGIYQVEPAKQGQGLLNSPLHVNPLEVTALTIGTILSFYNSIPRSSKQYVRGAYDPIEYVVQWVYRDTEAPDVSGRYSYNKILNYNTSNKAFFPYTVDASNTFINGIVYVASPGGINAAPSGIKYSTSNGITNTYWADEHDSTFVDWKSGNGVGINYVSTFTTGYKLHGQGERRYQVPYIYVYNRAGQPVSYYIQSLWDYATSEGSNRWSVNQLININSPNFGMVERRTRLRGRGLVLQIRITSVDGQPFDIMGWATSEVKNAGD